MYKHCISQPAKARQRQLEAGLLAYMARHPYESIVISDLCDYLEIPRKSFYRYFSNKDGALYALIDHTLVDFIDVFFKNGAVVTATMSEDFFKYWLTKKDLLRILAHSNLHGLLVQRAIDMAMKDTEYVPALFSEVPKDMRDHVLLFVLTGIMSLLAQWEKEDFRRSPKEMAKITLTILNESLFTI